jgi:hypothetical protein
MVQSSVVPRNEAPVALTEQDGSEPSTGTSRDACSASHILTTSGVAPGSTLMRFAGFPETLIMRRCQ